MMATQATGNVIVAPNVLMNLVALGLREVPGIARPGSVPRSHGQHRGDGIALMIDDHEVGIDCYLIPSLTPTCSSWAWLRRPPLRR